LKTKEVTVGRFYYWRREDPFTVVSLVQVMSARPLAVEVFGVRRPARLSARRRDLYLTYVEAAAPTWKQRAPRERELTNAKG
jgi:hypothetical protein